MSQEIGTSIGKVDCAANVGRCVIAAKLSGVAGTGAMKWSPIGFTEPTLEKLTISASPAGALRDGSSIKVTGSGGLPGESIMITQCVPGAGPNSIGTCDAIRGGQAVIADDGAYSIDYIAYRDILTTSTDDSSPSTWVPCEPCVLTAIRSNGQVTSATTSIELVSAPNGRR